MIIPRYILLIGVLITVVSQSCDDILVPDISKDTVQLKSPADSLVTDIQTHIFWWNELEDASGYNLQVVSPGYQSINALIMDTNVISNQFTLSLSEGIFEWSVTGYNDAYVSMGDTFRLIIRNDTGSILSNQMIQLLSPANAICTNTGTLHFSWSMLSGADIYRFQIGNDGFTAIDINLALTDNFYSFNPDMEGTLYWRVRAENLSSLTITPWAARNFTTDQTAPASPVLLLPLDGTILNIGAQNPDLIWNSDSDAFQDTLYVYGDIQTSMLLFKTPASTASFNLEDSNYDFGSVYIEDYYWQVISVDKAGNVSDLSELAFFFVQ